MQGTRPQMYASGWTSWCGTTPFAYLARLPYYLFARLHHLLLCHAYAHYGGRVRCLSHVPRPLQAINQHPYEARGCLLNDDVANLAKCVAATQRTLFCLDNNCASLGRIWCGR